MIAARLRWIISALTHPRAEARILAHEPASRGSRVVPLIHPRSTRQIAHCVDPTANCAGQQLTPSNLYAAASHDVSQRDTLRHPQLFRRFVGVERISATSESNKR